MSSRVVSKLKFTQSIKIMKVVLVHAFDPNTGEAEASGSVNSRPVWSTR